jgi:small subunit ribosomal protein S21
MPKVNVRPYEDFEHLINRFKKAVDKAGILKEVHKRECFERPGETRKKARAAAASRHKKRLEMEKLELEQQKLERKNSKQRKTIFLKQ